MRIRGIKYTSIAAAFVVLALAGLTFAQDASVPNVDTVISRAAEQRNVYINEFKNLLTQETKTFETFSKSGDPKKKRTIVSLFIVYQSSADGSIGEFRNVVSVDGRPIENADKRAQDFFNQLSKIGSSSQEWERIEREGSRFDEGLSINGLTLFQAVVLAENLRPAFEFKLEAQGTIEGRPVHVVSYRQVRGSRYISMSPETMVGDGKPEIVYDVELETDSQARVAGRFWIDAETYQVRKEERRVLLQDEKQSPPQTAVETVLEYQNSQFAILTPKRITFTQFRSGKGEPRREIAVAFEYDNFTRPDVEVKSADVKSQ